MYTNYYISKGINDALQTPYRDTLAYIDRKKQLTQLKPILYTCKCGQVFDVNKQSRCVNPKCTCNIG